MVPNSLNFCLSEKLFVSPSVLNKTLARYSNLGCRFFPFSTLNISCHSLLACRVSAERSALKHMGFLLYVTCCFSLAAFKSCFVFSLCQFDQYVSPQGETLFVSPIWDSLCLLNLIDYFLFHVGGIFNYNLFKNFLIHILSFSLLLLGPL